VEEAGSPGMVVYLLISWHSLGHLIIRVALNDKHPHSILSEIRRKNHHSVPDGWANRKWNPKSQVNFTFINRKVCQSGAADQDLIASGA
jgi:hypothetical protein